MLDWQHDHGITGDLVELGCYLGKSAVVVGAHQQPGERFTVLDLFEAPAGDEANVHEMAGSYSALTRAQFEQNYLRFHESLPVVVQAPSSEITRDVGPNSVRFLHVDASHLYHHVRGDIAASRELLAPTGVVAFDDYRGEHTPGVSAAVWEAVVNDGLVPLWVTPSKLYASWTAQPRLQDELKDWVAAQHGRAWCEYQQVAGHRLMRIKVLRPAEAPKPEPEPEPEPEPVPELEPEPQPQPERPPSRLRVVAKDVTPPVLARRLHRLRKRLEARRG